MVFAESKRERVLDALLEGESTGGGRCGFECLSGVEVGCCGIVGE